MADEIEIRDERKGTQSTDALVDVLSAYGVDSVEKLKKILEPSAYAIIPVSVLEDPNITPNAKLLYAELLALARKGGSCYSTNGFLRERLGVSLRTIQNCLVELQKLGMITISMDKNASGTWRTIDIVWQKGVQSLRGGMQKLHGGMQKLHAGDATGCTPGVQESAPQKRILRKRISRKDIAAASAAVSSEEAKCQSEGCTTKPIKGKLLCPTHTPMDVPKFVEWCGTSAAPHVRLIGEWAETIRPNLTTVAQWNEFISRNVRTAKRIIPFNRDQIDRAWERIERGRREGWLREFTLETLLGYLLKPE